MALFIEIKAADGTESRTRVVPGNNRFSVKSGDSYRFVDEATGFSPVNTAVKRLDNSLLVTGLERPGAAEQTRVELVEFYSVCSVGSPCQVEVQPEGAAAPVVVTSRTEPIGALADGSFVLYDPSRTASGTGGTVASSATSDSGGAFENVGAKTILYGVGGLAVVGLALSGGGGGGSDTAVSANPPAPAPSPAPSPAPGPAPAPSAGTPPPAAVIGAVATDNVVTLNEKAAGIAVSGTGTPGTTVSVALDGGSKTAVVDTAGNWSVRLAPGEIGADGRHVLNVTLTDAAGLTSPVATHAYTVNTVSSVSPAIATDSVVNGAERTAGFVLSGSGPSNAPAGTAIDITITGSGTTLQKTAATTAAGTWSTTVNVTDALADGAHTVSVAARIGNVAGAADTERFSVDTVAPAAPSIAPVAGDNVLSASERSAGVIVTGLAEASSVVNVTIGSSSQTVTANANGAWTSTTFGASAFPLSAGIVAVTATATDAAGNTSQPTAPPVLVIIERAVASDPAPAGGEVLGIDALLGGGVDASATVAAAGATTTGVIGPSAATTLALLDDPLHHGMA